MWKSMLLFLLTPTVTLARAPKDTTPHGNPLKQVTVEQLETFLAEAGGTRDGDLVRQLYNRELTERLSAFRLSLIFFA